MWVAKFKIKDDDDIYSPWCVKLKVEFYATPYTHYAQNKKIHLLVGGILAGSEESKRGFVKVLKKDKRIVSIEQYHDFLFIHANHPVSRELQTEIKIFYDPKFLRIKPVHVASDGWEYWEIASVKREEISKILLAAKNYYHCKILSMKEEKIRSVSSTTLVPFLSQKQREAISLAYKYGYYSYPQKLTIPDLAKLSKKSYSTIQEHLRRGENKLIDYFMKYR